ncbi:hypothetical protein A0O28_0032020 [Trichoderma guizhouense]|uniref:AAA+ ATPase domain-containing protein n=1 Tax=Trichoderma guizhouense TaxID=1491466 RepID=A0A1T3CM59_9HYPO|nr:hypothetical protein A0O28_0032020 [Trichoderma guizhouense]
MEIVDHKATIAGGGTQTQNTDNGHQEGGSSIYGITDACFNILERLVSASDTHSPVQLAPFISSETLSNESPRDIRGLHNSFAFWVDYTGTLAPIQASLDYRLQGHDQIKGMVIELLELVERNLCRLEQNSNENPRFSDAESQRRLSAIDSALERLNFLAPAIRKASVRSQDQDLLNFISEEDKLFRKMAILYVKRKYPNARPSLREYMGGSIAAHRRVLLLKHQHANKLKLRQAPNTPHSQKAEQPGVKVERHKMLAPEVNLRDQQSTTADSKTTQASKMDGKVALQMIHKRPTLSTQNSVSFQPDDSTQTEYPDPPRIIPGEKYVRCPYCLEPLVEAELLKESGNKYWMNHLNQDLHPYVCLFPRCTNSGFASQSEWSNHMTASHSQEWSRKVHATTWFCDLDHNAPIEFDNEEEWRKHMLTPLLHQSRSKLPTDSQLDALSIRKQRLALRGHYICPFCEDKPSQIAKMGHHGNSTEMEIILTNHIADHVKSLLFLALPALEHETAGGEQKPIASENLSYKRLRNSDSSLRASSRGSLKNISLTFDDNGGKPETQFDTRPALLSPQHITMPSEDNINLLNEAEVDNFFARIPSTEASFSWDFILPEGWAWDRAYGSSKAEAPSLVEAYENLLSRAIFAKLDDAPDPQNEDASKVAHKIPNTNMIKRRDELHQIAELCLRYCGETVDKTLLGHEIIPQNRVKNITGVVRWAENHIRDTIRNLPYTSIIVAGIALVLPLLGSPTAAEAANQDAFIYIASRMRYYAALESFLLFEDLNPELKKDLSNGIVNLYKLIIIFQMQNIIRFYGSRTHNVFLIEGINYNGWDRSLQDIKNNDSTIISNIKMVIPESRSDLVKSNLQTLEGLAHEADVSYTTFRSDLKVARKFDAAAQEWERRKRFGEQSNALDELMKYQGLKEVKHYFLDIKSKIDICKEQDPGRKANMLHMQRYNVVFQGNPGTGKTTIARLYAKLLCEEGILKSDYIKEMSGVQAASQSAESMKEILENITEIEGGGVIIFDEAYQLMVADTNRVGRQAIDIIITALENSNGTLAAVFVGHKDEISPLFEHNPGLESRIPYIINFPDFDDGALLQIFTDKILKLYKGSMRVEGDLDGLYMRIAIRRLAQARGSREFGNARAVENLLARIRERQANRLVREKSEIRNGSLDYLIFTKEDLIGPNPSLMARKCPAWIKLQELIGLEEVKQSVERLINMIELKYQRELREESPLRFSLNQVFVGPPGTGKTTVTKLYGQILVDLGCLSRGGIVLKTPADFIGDCTGTSESKTKTILKSTVGKVLVIDEAYMLNAGGLQNDQNTSKLSVIDTIVSMTKDVSGEDRCIILVGYEDRIRDLFKNVNPDLSRRFHVNDPFRFKNFTIDQLEEIMRLKMIEDDLSYTEDAIVAARELLGRALIRPNFTNASEINSILNAAKMSYTTRLSRLSLKEQLSATSLEAIDFVTGFFQRGSLEPSSDKALEGLVDSRIVNQLVAYQRDYNMVKTLKLDPGFFIPTNFILQGPPGTGKKTTARYMGKMLFDMDLVSTGEVVECSVANLIGQHIGHTTLKTREKLQDSLGHVLIISDSGQLISSLFAAEVVEELLQFLSNPSYIGRIVVILIVLGADIRKLLENYPALSSLFPEEIIFEVLSPEDCIKLLLRELESSGIAIRVYPLTDTDSEDYCRARQLFRALSVQSGWNNVHDVKNLAKQIVRRCIHTSHIIETQHELSITSGDIMDSMSELIIQRRRHARPSAPNQRSNDPALDIHQYAIEPPQFRKDIYNYISDTLKNEYSSDSLQSTPHRKSAGNKASSLFDSFGLQTADNSTTNKDKEQIPLSLEDDSKREEGVSDADWQNLSNKKRDQGLRSQLHMLSMKTLERQVKSFEEAGDEANVGKFRDRLEEIRRRGSEEEKIQKTLREMGRCDAGYSWIRDGEGYRCVGGSHYISDKELSGRI